MLDRDYLDEAPYFFTTPDVELGAITKSGLAEYMPKVDYDFSDAEQEFLESVRSEPFIPMSERRRRLAWEKELYRSVVRRLKETGVIEQVSVPLGKSRPLVLYQLKGAKPSIKHEFYVYWIIKQLAEKGLVCRAEKVGPDIQIQTPNAAINVELGKSSLEENVGTALSQFDTVVIASDSKKVLDRILVPKAKEGQKY